eukprot:CAMPEP_0115024738 /NCGR_PEP_ID=MMETSP0216-20121206/33474_1 /TAXON_ID=223996 /ORGANISM="Protocruzia adherens, Strain Boccale" /LENGTH=197 /DNA_ID=CAMNT_0002398969 /DNA_START=68 /DNA_END=661 /DNA_ORIENTATION=-
MDITEVGSVNTITFVTGNKNKLREFQAIIGDDLKFTFTSEKADLPELQGEPEEISRQKCVHAVNELKRPVLVEDTSLCFNALNGLPGPYIKYFLEKTGHEGLNNLVSAYEDKSAYAQCIFSFCKGQGEEVYTFVGRTPGKIVPARGPTNFGWDPVFQPDGFDETYAEMDSKIKNTISHRYRSVMELRKWLKENEDKL